MANADSNFYFAQPSDVHWGYQGPASPDAAVTLRRAVATVNALETQPEFIVFTGDLTRTTDDPVERRCRLAGRSRLTAPSGGAQGFQSPALERQCDPSLGRVGCGAGRSCALQSRSARASRQFCEDPTLPASWAKFSMTAPLQRRHSAGRISDVPSAAITRVRRHASFA
jgi:3',5'-cyclic AMP phosphodiesterase CpdA